jgi:hypothetical protein
MTAMLDCSFRLTFLMCSLLPILHNRNFDASLKSRDPSWGVRDLEALVEAASREGLELIEKIEMPANNLSLIFQRRKVQS